MPSTKNIVPSQFPTPQDGTIAYVLCVPDIPAWRQIVLGHLLTMTYGYFWDKNTGNFGLARDVMQGVVFPVLNQSPDCFCDLVADCVVTDKTVQNAIRKVVNATTTGTPADNLADGIIPTNNCDDDVVWGAISQFVDDLNLYVEDSFEVIETSTNFVEVISEWLGGFPIVGGLLSVIPDALGYIQDTLAEEYLSAYNQTLSNSIKCDLFCLFTDDCQIELDRVFTYFVEQAGLSSVPTDLTDLIDTLVNGVFTGDTSVYIMSAFALGFLALGDDTIGSLPFITFPSTNALRVSFALGANNPSDDWTLLCDPCTRSWCINFANGNGNVSGDASLVSDSVGRLPTVYNTALKRFEGTEPVTDESSVSGRIRFSIPPNTSISSVTGRVRILPTRSRSGDDAFVQLRDANNVILDTFGEDGLGVRDFTFTLDSSSNTTNTLDIRFVASQEAINDGAYAWLEELTLEGTGDPPPAYGGTEC